MDANYVRISTDPNQKLVGPRLPEKERIKTVETPLFKSTNHSNNESCL